MGSCDDQVGDPPATNRAEVREPNLAEVTADVGAHPVEQCRDRRVIDGRLALEHVGKLVDVVQHVVVETGARRRREEQARDGESHQKACRQRTGTSPPPAAPRRFQERVAQENAGREVWRNREL